MIHSWQINRLKVELINARHSGRQTLLYLACILTVQSASWALGYVSGVTLNLWDRIDEAVFFVFLIIGTIYCFYTNGGTKGRDFISRYVSLAWVFGVRYAFMALIPVSLFFYLIPSLFVELPDETRWYDVLFNAVLRVPFYLILAGHIRDVALNKVPSEKEVADFRDEYAEDFDQTKYPTMLRRYMATFIDMFLVLSAIIALIYMIQGENEFTPAIRIWIAVAIIFSYEPVFTSRLCTLGQRITGIRIRKLYPWGKISILDAYLRSVVKLLLGIVSFFSIPVTRKKRALHDFVARSEVVYAEHTLH
jgi:hypothetical protein